ncbi:MAG TPA: hypothetical protein PL033_11175 [Candidatus Brocadiia bacterium]|nr:hypothetical protein [Candidatus Brocadiia bacterium]
MELQPENSPNISNPTAEQIRKTLSALGDTDTFFSLRDDKDRFVQIYGDKESGCTLEYCVEAEKVFQSVSGNVPLETGINVFEKFAAGDDSWIKTVEWRSLDEVEPPPSPVDDAPGEREMSRKEVMDTYMKAATGSKRGPGCSPVIVLALLALLGLVMLA